MAFDPKPSTWLGAGYTVDAGAHTISMNTKDAASNKLLAQLSDASADPTTGDIREVVLGLLEALYQAWLAQGSNVPAKMTIARISSLAPNGQPTYNYSVKCVLSTPSAIAVTSE